MAQKRIEKQELIDPKAVESIIGDLMKLEAELKKILEANKEIIKSNPFKSGADVKKFNEAAQTARKTEDAISAVRKKRIREEQQLKELRTKEAQDLAQVNALKKEQNLINRQEAQANTKALGAYKNLSAQLNILRKRYKDVAVSQGVNSKAAQDLAAEVNKLDKQVKEVDGSVGQFQRNVGNYKDQITQSIQATGAFGQGLIGIVSGLRSATAASLSFLATPLGAVIGAIGLALAAVVGTFKLFTESLKSTEKGQTALNKIMAVFTGVLNGVLTVVEPLALQLVDGIANGLDLITKAAGLASSALQTAFRFVGLNDLADGIADVGSQIADTTQKAVKLAEAETELNKILREQEKVQLDFQNRAEKLRQIRDDESLSIEERIEANEKLGKVLDEQTTNELDLAQRALEIAELRAEVEGESPTNLDAIAEAETKILEIEERITGQRSEQLVNLNSLKKEQQDLLKAKQDEIKAQQDLVKAQQDLVKAQQDEVRERDKNIKLLKVEKGLKNSQAELEKKADERRIKAANERLILQNDLVDNIEKENPTELIDFDAIEEAQQRAIETSKTLAKTLIESFNEADRARQNLVENELETTKDNLKAQQRLAERGLANTLAFEEEKAARLEAERERLAKKAEKRQKTLAYLTAFTEFLKEDPNSAAGKALAQVAIAETISGAFYEGTENVASDLGSPVFSGRDGYVIRVDGQERILNPMQNRKVGSMSNDDLANLAQAYQQGKIYTVNHTGINEKHLSRLEKAIKENKTISVDPSGFVTMTEFKEGMKKITRVKRPKI